MNAVSVRSAFSASALIVLLMLLVGKYEEHTVCKNLLQQSPEVISCGSNVVKT